MQAPPPRRTRRFAPEEVFFDDSYGVSYEGIPAFVVEDGGEEGHARAGERAGGEDTQHGDWHSRLQFPVAQ